MRPDCSLYVSQIIPNISQKIGGDLYFNSI